MSYLCGTGCYAKTLIPSPVRQNFPLCINPMNLIKKWIPIRKKTKQIMYPWLKWETPKLSLTASLLSGGTVFIKTVGLMLISIKL